jgi:hypothetical protein
VSVSVAIAEDAPSEATIENVVAANETVGVPLTTPVVEFIDRPAGSAGVMVKVLVPVISVDTNAVVAVIASPTETVAVCVAGASDGAAPTELFATGRATTKDVNPTIATTRSTFFRIQLSNQLGGESSTGKDSTSFTVLNT